MPKCEICGKNFTRRPRATKQKTCSEKCSFEWRRRSKKRWNQKRKERQGRQLQSDTASPDPFSLINYHPNSRSQYASEFLPIF